jgi:putative transposase
MIPKRRSPPSQTWRTFLANHVRDLVALDFFAVPIARLSVLFVLVVLAHHRRRVVHFNVTEHPTAAWTAQQVVDAFPDESAGLSPSRPRPRLRPALSAPPEGHEDRGGAHGAAEPMAKPVCRAPDRFYQARVPQSRPRSRRAHLRHILTRYFVYYHQARTHLALDKDAPDLRPIEPSAAGPIVRLPEVGGLHHRYVRQAA